MSRRLIEIGQLWECRHPGRRVSWGKSKTTYALVLGIPPAIIQEIPLVRFLMDDGQVGEMSEYNFLNWFVLWKSTTEKQNPEAFGNQPSLKIWLY